MSTPFTTTARRLLGFAILLLAAVPAAGCGGGCCDDPPFGTLEVRNDPTSIEGIDAVEVSTPFGPIDHYDVFLAPGEFQDIDLIAQTYDIDLLWSDATFETLFAVDIFDGQITIVTGVH